MICDPIFQHFFTGQNTARSRADSKSISEQNNITVCVQKQLQVARAHRVDHQLSLGFTHI